jgi:hypothetical protein
MISGAEPSAPGGNRNANKHGTCSANAKAATRYVKALELRMRDVDC